MEKIEKFKKEAEVISYLAEKVSLCFDSITEFRKFCKTKEWYDLVWTTGGIKLCKDSFRKSMAISKGERSEIWQKCLEDAIDFVGDLGTRDEVLEIAKKFMEEQEYLNPIDPVSEQIKRPIIRRILRKGNEISW